MAGLCGAPCASPCCWCASCVCLPCANYYIRSKALEDMRNYKCFQGYTCPCIDCCCSSCEKSCGPCCLAIETCMCPHLSVFATRHYIQDKYRVQNSPCEDTCFDCVIAMECLMCCLPEDSHMHELLHCIVHLCFCIGMPCMQVQHNVQLDVQSGARAPMLQA